MKLHQNKVQRKEGKASFTVVVSSDAMSDFLRQSNKGQGGTRTYSKQYINLLFSAPRLEIVSTVTKLKKVSERLRRRFLNRRMSAFTDLVPLPIQTASVVTVVIFSVFGIASASHPSILILFLSLFICVAVARIAVLKRLEYIHSEEYASSLGTHDQVLVALGEIDRLESILQGRSSAQPRIPSLCSLGIYWL